MTTDSLYVIDTHAVIWFFHRAFGQNSQNSEFVTRLLSESLSNPDSRNRLVVPSICLVEIFDKFARTEHDALRVYFECFSVLNESSNVDIRELDRETMEFVMRLDSDLERHEIHDKIVVATAQMLEACLVSRDPKIWTYAANSQKLSVKWQ